MDLQDVRRHIVLVLAMIMAAVFAGCGEPTYDTSGEATMSENSPPERFTIVPDDYHVPYAGTAEDGRKFFLSQELFAGERNYVGLFLWAADGTFDEVRVDAFRRPEGVPPGQAVPAGADELVEARLAELGSYVLEPIVVEPFLAEVGGEEFGWRFRHDDGPPMLNIEPGDFIAYYEPWDGLEYDT